MTENKDQSKLSPDFNSKLKKSIKRNVLYKNILTITLIGALKSAMIIFDTIFSLFTSKK
ncbi:MAG: hypothetical protein IT276_11085 [Ignavibacteriaceae bacterium]|nr:hypothetical protein [Ignavibacterium sp.]MCC6255450.1 hypothetical protein [Ignavibacteriaceae bacterium]HMN26008.1 hypothetical protein [Ignavibacteriaceae bacterium]HRN24921.1 hypothetical protein [Ignavibacteriaceae bacterium]HRP93063.1 hypothetical protein [Ignavibacteriaceae bacterium]